jgi:hypothetical protein
VWQYKARKRPATWTETVVVGVYLVAYIAAFCWLYDGFSGSYLGSLVFMFGVPVLGFVSTVIHEAGHAIGAIAAGWRPFVISAWPFAWHVPNNAIVLFGKGGGYDGGGYVAGVPSHPIANTRLRHAIFVAAGPIVSLAVGIGLMTAAMAPSAPPPDFPGSSSREALPPQTYAYPRLDPFREVQVINSYQSSQIKWERARAGLMMALAFLSFASFVGTIIPRTLHDGQTTDGQMLLNALRRGPGPPYGAWGYLAHLLHYNVRLRDLPDWMLSEYRQLTEQSGQAPSANDAIDIGRTLDARVVDIAKARAQVDAYRAAYGDDDWLASIDAYLAAVHEGDGERAAAALANRPARMSDAAMLSAAEAALAARTGDATLLARKLDEMESRLLRDSPFPNPTFVDIRARIESVARSRAAPVA